MQFISAQQVDQVLEFPLLINALQRGFASEFSMPPRQVFPLSTAGSDAFALLPAWTADLIGVKAFCYFPDNSAVDLPTLHSSILIVPTPARHAVGDGRRYARDLLAHRSGVSAGGAVSGAP